MRDCVRKQSYVHPVHPDLIRVDAKNRSTGRRCQNHVHASTPKCNVRPEMINEAPAQSLSKYKGYASWGGRMDVDVRPQVPYCDYSRPPKTAEGGRGGRVSDEVTL